MPGARVFSLMAPFNHCHNVCAKHCGCCCCDVLKYMEFTVKGKNGEYLNYFCKEYNGFCNELCTMADRYNFELPSNNDDENAIFLAAM